MTPLAPLLLPLGLLFFIGVTANLVNTIQAKSDRAKILGKKLWLTIFFSGFTALLSFFSGEVVAGQVWGLSTAVLLANMVLIARAKEEIMQAIRRR
jgi:hypothetical protein